jgi:glycine/D-amino acid oxidase-like deaminating enzyme
VTAEELRGLWPETDAGAHAVESQDTIIVGAGIAGLACARRLHDAGHTFLVISEKIGGRIQRSGDNTVNLGAYYVRSDYSNVNRYMQLGRRLDWLSIQRHDADGNAYGYWNRRLLLHLAQAARFLRLLVQFRRRYNRLKQRSVVIGQVAAIRSDPLLQRLYHQPAADFIEQHRIGDLAHWYLEPGVHGTTFTGLLDITAFTLLIAALPILIPAYEFTPRLDELIDGFVDAIAADSVTGISTHPNGYEVRTRAHGTLITQRLVVATPPDVAQQLLGLPTSKRPATAHMFHVAGTLRHPYDRGDIHLFPATDTTLAIVRQQSGAILACSQERHPDFDRYLTTWRVIEHTHWNPAFHIIGDGLHKCEQGPNLYMIGDHNIVGLEDAYLTGLYAANRIIAQTRARRPATQGDLVLNRTRSV